MKIVLLLAVLTALASCGHPKKQFANLSKMERYMLQAKMAQKEEQRKEHANRSLKKTEATHESHHTYLSRQIYAKHLLKNKKKDSKRLKAGLEIAAIADNVCVTATHVYPVVIPYVTKAIRGIKKLKVTHKSGNVGCDKGRESNFGCKDAGYGIYFIQNGVIMAPDFNFDKSLKVIGQDGDNKMFWEINGQKDSKEYENQLDSITIAKSDRLEAVYSEGYFWHNNNDNIGTTCFQVAAEYDPSVEQSMGYDDILVAEDICVDGKQQQPTKIGVKEEIKGITKIVLVHKSHQIGCDKGRESNFGCKDVGFGIHIVKGKKEFAPDFGFDKTQKVIGQDGNNKMFWEINGKQDGKRMEMVMDKATIGPNDDLGAVYSEAFYAHNAGDNIGKTCFDVWVQVPEEKKEEPEPELQKEEVKDEPKDEPAKIEEKKGDVKVPEIEVAKGDCILVK